MLGDTTDLAVTEQHLRWLHMRNLSPNTIRARYLALRRFSRFLGHHPLTASTEDVMAFRERRTRSGAPLSIEAQAMELSHLAGFFKWAVVEGYRDDDPTMRVPRPKLPRGLPNPIPEEDFIRAVDAAEPTRIKPWLMLAGFAGLRACEIAPLRGEDLWWHTEPAMLIVRAGKGGDSGAVPIAPDLAAVLKGMPRKGWLFPQRDGQGGPVKPWTVSHGANNHLHRLGIPHTLHSLRHRFGTQVYRASHGDLRQTQELMRHRSPISTARYTLVDGGEAAGIVAALPSVHRLRAVS